MLLMQEPQLLLLDEPVAGMTDDETMRSAELFLIARRRVHAGRRRARHGLRRARSPTASRCCTRASVLAEGSMDDVQAERAGHRSVPGPMSSSQLACSRSRRTLNQYYGGSHILRDVVVRRAGRHSARRCSAATASARPRCCKCLDGPAAGALGRRSGFDGATITSLPPYARARLGLGYVPQGRDIFPRLTVQENLQMGLATQKKGTRHSRSFIYEMFPVLTLAVPSPSKPSPRPRLRPRPRPGQLRGFVSGLLGMQDVAAVERADVVRLRLRETAHGPPEMHEVRLDRMRQRMHPDLVRQAIALARVAGRARRDDVRPVVRAAARHRDQVIARQRLARTQLERPDVRSTGSDSDRARTGTCSSPAGGTGAGRG